MTVVDCGVCCALRGAVVVAAVTGQIVVDTATVSVTTRTMKLDTAGHGACEWALSVGTAHEVMVLVVVA